MIHDPFFQKKGCRPWATLFVTIALSIACIFGGFTVNARAVTTGPPPPTSVYRWFNTDNSLCQYDKGNLQQNTMGGCNSATRWSRMDCGNRTAGGLTLYYCEYQSQASLRCMVAAANNVVGTTTTCNGQDGNLFSDPDGGIVFNLYYMKTGHTGSNMETGLDSGSGVDYVTLGTDCCYNWNFLSG